MTTAPRTATRARNTAETTIDVTLTLDGESGGHATVDTGLPFFDHMVSQLGKHGGFDLTVKAVGDLTVDTHHTVEDVAIVLGQTLRAALGDKAGIRRFGDAWIPMDETLAHAAVDVSGRPYCVHTGEPGVMVGFTVGGNYPTVLNRHVFESIAFHAQIALHLRVIHGRDPHHITEAEYKAFARALRAAAEPDPRIGGIPSTKGVL